MIEVEVLDWKNRLYFGDNLDVMRKYIADESVDLIYLDPPFNSKTTYNVLFGDNDESQPAARIIAFEDTWHWGLESEAAYHELITGGPVKLAGLVQALRQFLGQDDMMAYIVMMAIRLVEMHRVLKPKGSVYLHCDATASHYLKLVMDAVWGAKMFRNEIVWLRDPAGKGAKRVSAQWPRNFDVLLFYSKTDHNYFQQQYTALSEAQKRAYRYRDERGHYKAVQRGDYSDDSMERFRREGRVHVSSTGKEYVKYYLDEAVSTVGAVWSDICGFGTLTASREKLGYPTQKPESLLERIIRASSAEGDLVLDPFCGCGTTLAVAERLNRRWIGIDITHLAITLTKHRLIDTFGSELSPCETIGDPKDLQSARVLAEDDRYQFGWWALGLVDARPAQDRKKREGAGVYGYIYFFDDNSGEARKIIVQVSDAVKRSDIATLKGDVEREKAVIGAFLTLQEPSGPVIEEAATAGFYESEHVAGKYPRIQVLTIEGLLGGKEIEYPRLAVGTFKKTERKRK